MKSVNINLAHADFSKEARSQLASMPLKILVCKISIRQILFFNILILRPCAEAEDQVYNHFITWKFLVTLLN